MGKRSGHILFALYVAAVTTVSLWPRAAMPEAPSLLTIPHADKLIHTGMYAFMAGLGAFTTLQPRTRPFPLAGFLFACLYGILLEVLQTAIGGVDRSMSAADALANAIGALLGSLGYLGWSRRSAVLRSDLIEEG